MRALSGSRARRWRGRARVWNFARAQARLEYRADACVVWIAGASLARAGACLEFRAGAGVLGWSAGGVGGGAGGLLCWPAVGGGAAGLLCRCRRWWCRWPALLACCRRWCRWPALPVPPVVVPLACSAGAAGGGAGGLLCWPAGLLACWRPALLACWRPAEARRKGFMRAVYSPDSYI